MNFSKLQELASSKGKLLLIESFYITQSGSNIQVFDTNDRNRIIESRNNIYESIGIIRDVPVTRFTENMNGRVYPKNLWLKVKEIGSAEGTFCLADHPSDDSDGSVKDIVGIWRNFRVNDKHGLADLYLVGSYGKLFLDVLRAGGRNGLSSVGFGELLEDNRTVNPDTYELVRLADWVLVPSQNVYAQKENIDTNSLKESYKLNTNYNGKVSYHMDDKVRLLTVRNNIKEALKESKRAQEIGGKSLLEARDNLEDLLKYIPDDMLDEQKQVKEEILLLEDKIKSEIETVKDKADSIEKEKDILDEKYRKSQNILLKLKDRIDKLNEQLNNNEIKKELYESRYKKLEKNYKLLLGESNKYKSQIEKLSEKLHSISLKKKLHESRENILIKNSNLMKQDIKLLLEDKKHLTKEVKSLLEDKKDLTNGVYLLEYDKDSMLKDITLLLKDRIRMQMDIHNLLNENKRYYESIKKLLLDKRILLDKINKVSKKSKNMHSYVESLKDKLRLAELKLRQKEEVSYDEVHDDINEAEKENYEDELYKAVVDPSIEYMDADNKIGAPFSNYNNEEGFLENNDIKNYYNKQVKKVPYLRNFESDILNSRSLKEAIQKVKLLKENIKDRINKIPLLEKVLSSEKDSITGSSKDIGWLGDRD